MQVQHSSWESVNLAPSLPWLEWLGQAAAGKWVHSRTGGSSSLCLPCPGDTLAAERPLGGNSLASLVFHIALLRKVLTPLDAAEDILVAASSQASSGRRQGRLAVILSCSSGHQDSLGLGECFVVKSLDEHLPCCEDLNHLDTQAGNW